LENTRKIVLSSAD
jgi:hypothetical protein